MSAREPLSIDQFLARYPWPSEMLARGNPLNWLWHYDLSCQAEEIWPHLIETSRFNRAMGLTEMQFEEQDGLLLGQSVNGGVRHEWVEQPWDWVSGRELCSIRRYSRGFGHHVRSIYLLEPLEPGRQRLYVYFGWIPRGMIGRVALKLGMPSLEKGFRTVLDKLAGELGQPRPSAFVGPRPAIAEGAPLRMAAIRDALVSRGLARDPIDKLVEFIHVADDMDAYRIQVRRLAHLWGLAETELLHLCLHATREGLLDMSWDVICPHCRGVRAESSTLGGVASSGSCDVCQIEFGTDADNAVEITFHVHPSIRDVPKVYYCSAEPSTKLHIKLQQRLDAGAERTLPTLIGPGRYRMRRLGQRDGIYLDVRDSVSERELEWRASDDASGERTSAVGPSVHLVNDSDDTQTFVVEDVRWADEALRPADLFNLQEFRDLFSEQYLGADVQLSVGEQTILFTDMVGSTELYARQGDPAAFVEVRRHFGEIFAVVRQNHGAIVKTIGDAAMASFSNPVDAVRAARQIHERFPPGEANDSGESPIRLRISLNTGPCIAVNLNSNIDYFGGTVNLAAKLQSCAGAGQIAMTRAVWQSPGVGDYVTGQGAAIEESVFDYKSLKPIAYCCWSTDR